MTLDGLVALLWVFFSFSLEFFALSQNFTFSSICCKYLGRYPNNSHVSYSFEALHIGEEEEKQEYEEAQVGELRVVVLRPEDKLKD